MERTELPDFFKELSTLVEDAHRYAKVAGVNFFKQNFRRQGFLDTSLTPWAKRSLAIGSGKRLTDIEPFDIPVMYEYKGLVMKDVIRNVEFTDNGVDVKQGDKSIATQFTLLPSHIDWNVAM